MKKKMIMILLLLISFSAIYLAAIPYRFKTRTKDYSSDVVFKNQPEISEVDLEYDYTEYTEIDDSINGRVSLEYRFSQNNGNQGRLPFYGRLNQKYHDNQTVPGKEVMINNGKNYKTIFGDSDIDEALCDYTYDELGEHFYERKEDNDLYYVYSFENFKNQKLGMPFDFIDTQSILTVNLEVIQLTKKEKKAEENKELLNKFILRGTDYKAIIVCKQELDEYITNVGKKVSLQGSKELYSYLLAGYDVNINDVLPVAENEISPKFQNIGYNWVSLDDFVNEKRVMVFEFDIPKEADRLNVSYNNVSGMDSRYEKALYEIEFHYHKDNYSDSTKFNVSYSLSDDVKYIQFSLFELEQEGNRHFKQFEQMPSEVKIFFSGAEQSKKTMGTFYIECSGFIKYIILPFLFLFLGIVCVTDIIRRIQDRSISRKEKWINLKTKLVDCFPQILTFYLVGFKFYTLYINDSGLNKTNVLILIVFLMACLVYFVAKTMTSINYRKLIFYGILAGFTAVFVQDPAFIMLIALGVCYADKGAKPFLKALFLSIAFFSLQTVIFCGFGVLKDEIFIVYSQTWQPRYERHSLGFSHPNTVSLFLFIGYLSLMLYRKTSYLEKICVAVLTGVVYSFTRSRTGCLCVVLLLMLDIISDGIRVKGKWRYGLVLAFPLFTMITILAGKYVNKLETLNSLISGRLSIFSIYLKENRWTLFGFNGVSDPTYDILPIDNLYLNVLIFQGIICYSIYLVIYVILSYKVVKTKDCKLFVGLIVYFIYGLTEATLMNYVCAVFVAIFFISTLGDKYDMSDRHIERKKGNRNLYILNHLGQATLDSSKENVILLLGQKKEKEYNGAKVVCVNKWNVIHYLNKYLKTFDPQEIHCYDWEKVVSFGLLTTVFYGDLIVHIGPTEDIENWKRHRKKLFAKTADIVRG